jgi:hypothetical protein
MQDLADWKQFQFFEPSERGPKELTVSLPEGHPLAPKKVRLSRSLALSVTGAPCSLRALSAPADADPRVPDTPTLRPRRPRSLT